MTSWALLNGQRELRENLRRAIRERGLTQADAADRAGVEYSRLMNALGAGCWLRSDEVDAFAEVLDMTGDELAGNSVYKGDVGRYGEPRHRSLDRDADPFHLGVQGLDPGLRDGGCTCGGADPETLLADVKALLHTEHARMLAEIRDLAFALHFIPDSSETKEYAHG